MHLTACFWVVGEKQWKPWPHGEHLYMFTYINVHVYADRGTEAQALNSTRGHATHGVFFSTICH